MSSSSGSYDTKRFPLCEPWHGQRGKAYKERFLPDFQAACMGRHDTTSPPGSNTSAERCRAASSRAHRSSSPTTRCT